MLANGVRKGMGGIGTVKKKKRRGESPKHSVKNHPFLSIRLKKPPTVQRKRKC